MFIIRLCNACGLRYSRSVARQGKMANQQQQQRSFHPKKKSRLSLSSSRSTSPSSPTLTTSNSTSPSSTPRQFNISELININYWSYHFHVRYIILCNAPHTFYPLSLSLHVLLSSHCYYYYTPHCCCYRYHYFTTPNLSFFLFLRKNVNTLHAK